MSTSGPIGRTTHRWTLAQVDALLAQLRPDPENPHTWWTPQDPDEVTAGLRRLETLIAEHDAWAATNPPILDRPGRAHGKNRATARKPPKPVVLVPPPPPEPKIRRTGLTQAEIIEDLEWMAETGEDLDGAARRLGIQPETIRQYARRAGRHDLLNALAPREDGYIRTGRLPPRRTA